MFFTSGGSEAVESAWKLVRNYHRINGEGTRTKLIARELAYHGVTLGALAATGLTGLRSQFEPLTPAAATPLTRTSYHWPPDRDRLWAADAIEERIIFEGPETVGGRDPRARSERRRLHPAAGGLLPARPRDL